jgi:uncharacterized protein YdeI (YjbR/CyaY-like superfamily)
MAGALRELRLDDARQWRRWLAANQASAQEIWLVFHKKRTGVDGIRYKDALDEALCSGWVDSLVKRLDDRRYAIKFTPRRADSRWSDVNRKRYAELSAAGRLTAAGKRRPPTSRGSAARPRKKSLPTTLPPYIASGLKSNPKARRNYEALPLEQRRRYFAWIDSAKREETKLRRLNEAVRLLTKGQVLGLK